MNLSLKQAALALSAAAVAAIPGLVSAQGVDTLESKLYPRYVTDDMLLNADKDASNWLHYGRDYQTTRYSPLTAVNRDNVKNLRPVWNLSFGVLEGQDSQAVVVNGMIYVTTSFNKVIAVDAATGTVAWKYDRELPGDVFPKLCCDVVNRGVTVYKNKVYLATLDAHIVALDNATGKVVWDKKHGDYTYAETFTIMPMALQQQDHLRHGRCGIRCAWLDQGDQRRHGRAGVADLHHPRPGRAWQRYVARRVLEVRRRLGLDHRCLRQGDQPSVLAGRQPWPGLRPSRARRRQPVHQQQPGDGSRHRQDPLVLQLHA